MTHAKKKRDKKRAVICREDDILPRNSGKYSAELLPVWLQGKEEGLKVTNVSIRQRNCSQSLTLSMLLRNIKAIFVLQGREILFNVLII